MSITFYIRSMIALTVLFMHGFVHGQESEPTPLVIDAAKTYQTIDNFAASDAWACQFVGNWPEQKKNAIADWLFSMDTLANGNPKGIGLSMWRYNIGAGSAHQGQNSGIKDEWRRTASFANGKDGESARLQAQNWFMMAARKRGVKQFLGFFNSPPVQLTKNGKAFANKGICNIDSSNYTAFARFAVDAIKQVQKTTGITFNYISPVNEPQWDWSDGGQEGCPYSNKEVSSIVKSFNQAFISNRIATKIVLPESGHLKYLQKDDDKPGKGNQIHAFFNATSPLYIGNLPSVSQSIASHSYFSTSPYDTGIALRAAIKKSIDSIKGLGFWQSEYCILGDNAGEINGTKRDLGLDAALYVAKVIHQDLVAANATAWQWWLAVSPYDYKDGLVYIDSNKADGNYYDSKMLWALGNYSRFIRPGMKRIDIASPAGDLLVSGYKNIQDGKLVVVIVNTAATGKAIKLNKEKGSVGTGKKMITYTTDAVKNLEKNIVAAGHMIVPAKSVVSVIIDR
jgi:hypothetical protein